MLEHYSDEDLLKMFEAFAVKGKARKAVWFPLIASWKDKNYTAIQVFKLMKLDQEMDNPPYDKLLRLWVELRGFKLYDTVARDEGGDIRLLQES
ncbi:hypothetical protein KXD40_006066 [Peronospora effusa]|nr:hypothetical protein KXD40_006066 [Peronospora effusa]